MREEVDLSICEFIEDTMWFFSYYDFCDNRRAIKYHYDNLSKQERKLYKWYVYANIHMGEMFKNRIWDYLNGYDNGEELLSAKKFYREK